MKEIIILEFDYPHNNETDRIHPVVIRDKDHVVLVDCGPMHTLDILEKLLLKNNVDPTDITHILITHHDQDHIGSLFDFKEKYPSVLVISSVGEADYISGEKPLERLVYIEKMQEKMSAKKAEKWENLKDVLKSIKPVPVDIRVKPTDVLDICGGIEILDTKGHTSNHISLYLKHMDTLIAGDAAFVKDRRLVVGPPAFTMNMNDAEASLEKIKQINARNVICYHGGLI